MGEAGRLIDLGIKGEKEVSKVLVSFALAQELYDAAVAEDDGDTRRRVAERIKETMTKYAH